MRALRKPWRWQVGFTYPGASKQQLSDVNVRVALSSRIAVLGANGAGKVRVSCRQVLGKAFVFNACNTIVCLLRCEYMRD